MENGKFRGIVVLCWDFGKMFAGFPFRLGNRCVIASLTSCQNTGSFGYLSGSGGTIDDLLRDFLESHDDCIVVEYENPIEYSRAVADALASTTKEA